MASYGDGLDVDLGLAAADLSSSQYCFVALTTSGTVELADAAGDKVVGVLQNAPTAGKMATVRVSGISKVKCGAAISNAGVRVTNEATTGQATPLAVADITTNNLVCCGVMLDPSNADGDIGRILLTGVPGLINQAYGVVTIT